MENSSSKWKNMLQKIKEPFPKIIDNAYKVLAGWKNCFGRRDNPVYDANNGIAFATTGTEQK